MGNRPGQTLHPLSDADLAVLAAAPATVRAVDLARQLGRPYFTVNAALRRIRRDGWACPLVWRECAVCGQPGAFPVQRTRLVHVGCERARAVWRARQARLRRPGQSTPYVRAYRQTQEGREKHRAEGRARSKALWPTLPAEQQDALLDKVHGYDVDAYAETQPVANQSGAGWTADEDAYVLEHLRTPARDVALVLGRTLWAVWSRRLRLRRRGLGDTGDGPDGG